MEDGDCGQDGLLCPEGQVATRLSTGASDTGGSATAARVLPIPERALRVGQLEQGGGTALAVS